MALRVSEARRADTPDGAGIDGGVEPDLLHLAVPGETVAGQQILGFDPAIVRKTEFPEGHLETGALRMLLVQVDREQQEVVHRRRSEEHTSELQSPMSNSYAVFG